MPESTKLWVPSYGLTETEEHVLLLHAQALSRKECASVLGVSMSTLDTHIRRILRKTGAPTMQVLVRRVVLERA